MVKHFIVPTHDEITDRWLQKQKMTIGDTGEWIYSVAFSFGDYLRYNLVLGIWEKTPEDTIRKELLEELKNAKDEGISPTKHTLDSITHFAKIEIRRTEKEWDQNHDLIVLRNGVFDLKTKTLRPHSPLDYATYALPYDFNPDAVAPAWETVLRSLIPEVVLFLQEFAGYLLTPDTRHEIALGLIGSPGSGKSTFLAGLETLTGPLCVHFGLADIERSRFGLSVLCGKTLAVSNEQPTGRLQNTHILNQIISGEPISVEEKFKERYEITPGVKMVFAMNELPDLPSGNNGLMRRLVVIPFKTIPGIMKDVDLKNAIKEEGPGIFNWAIEGYLNLRKRNHFLIPECGQRETDEYRASLDTAAAFISECCETGATFKIQASLLYERYRGWCEKNGYRYKSMTMIARDWKRLGFEKHQIEGLLYYIGLK